MGLQIIHEAWRMLRDYLVQCSLPSRVNGGSCMNGARSGGWFIESQRIGARTCTITSNVLHQDYNTPWLCRDVEQRVIPTAFFPMYSVHLFGTPCLVHVSLHPTIWTVLWGISIPIFSSPEYFFIFNVFLLVAPLSWVAFSLVWGELA